MSRMDDLYVCVLRCGPVPTAIRQQVKIQNLFQFCILGLPTFEPMKVDNVTFYYEDQVIFLE